MRIDALGGFFAAGLAAYLVYGNTGLNPSNVGFSLNMAGTCSECRIEVLALSFVQLHSVPLFCGGSELSMSSKSAVSCAN